VRVALTFDAEHPARPCSGRALEQILAALDRASVQATFFVQGRWVQSDPDGASRIAAAGHLIGNHSHYHAPMNALIEEAFDDDVRDAEAAIRAVTGRVPKPWFRCPFGAGMDDPEVLRRLDTLGYHNVGWDVDPRDWHADNDAGCVARDVLEGVDGRADSIVLLHSWPDATAEALPQILDGLAEAGAELQDVAALLG
jgi:peptidoglycan/xylan/chitin deacetylase (PgdA/CDA1 family)